MTDPQSTQTATDATDATDQVTPLTAESLIEEVSIDGMCGVY